MTEPQQVTIQLPASDTYKLTWNALAAGYSEDREFNLLYLRGIEQYLHQKCLIRGHLFLNEALDALHMPRVSYGQLIGWHDSAVSLGIELNGPGSEVKLNLKTQGNILSHI